MRRATTAIVVRHTRTMTPTGGLSAALWRVAGVAFEKRM
jgi:hypothetical protein